MKRYRVLALGVLSLLVVLAGSLVAPEVTAQGNGQATTTALTLGTPEVTPFKALTASQSAVFSCGLTATGVTMDYHPTFGDSKGIFYTNFRSTITWTMPQSLVPGQPATVTLTPSASIGTSGQQPPGQESYLYAKLNDPSPLTFTRQNTRVGEPDSQDSSRLQLEGLASVTVSKRPATTGTGFRDIFTGIAQTYTVTLPANFTGNAVNLSILAENGGLACQSGVSFNYTRPLPTLKIECAKSVDNGLRPVPDYVYSTPKDQERYVLAYHARMQAFASNISGKNGEVVQVNVAWTNANKQRMIECYQRPLSAVLNLKADEAKAKEAGDMLVRTPLAAITSTDSFTNDIEYRYQILDELEKIVRKPENAQQVVDSAKGEGALPGVNRTTFDSQVIVYDSTGRVAAKGSAVRFDYQIRYPIVFVPGTAGSRLVTAAGANAWPQNLTPGNASSLTSWGPMRLNDQGKGGELVVTDVFRSYIAPTFKTSVYQGFIDHMTGGSILGAITGTDSALVPRSYKEGQNLLMFPYDWRRDINEHPATMDVVVNNALNLNYNRKALNSTVCVASTPNAAACASAMNSRPAYTRQPEEKVVVITHSQGGLVGRAYTAAQTRADKVAYMIQLAPTNYGTPKTIKAVTTTGYSFEAPFLDPQVGKWMAINYPAAYYQFPMMTDGSGRIDQVLYDGQGKPITDVQGELTKRLTTFVFCDSITASGLKDCARSNINEKVLTNATVFHQIKNLPSPVTMGVPDFVVAGTDQATIIGFRRTSKLIDVSVPVLASALGGNLPPGGFKDSIPDTALMAAGYMAPEYLDQPTYKIVSTSTDPFSGAVEFKVEIPYYEEVYANCGDNLVPLHSAISLPGVQPLLVAGVKHGGMTEATVVQQLIDKLLGGVKPVGIDPKTITCSSHMSGEAAIPGQPASPPAVNNGVTITAEQSPANLHVFDAQGRHTGLATDGSIELGIPGSFFEDRGRTQEAHLPPTSQQLRVTLEGLLDTRMNVRIISGDGKTEKHVDYLAVPETKTSKAEIKFTPSALDNSTTISVDTKGDGKSVQTLKPSSVTTVTGSGATTTQGQSTAPPLGNPTTPTAKPSGSKGGGCGAGSGAELGLVFTGLIALGVAKRPRRKREG